MAATVAGCGAAAAPHPGAEAGGATCQQVSAVLSDGPAPSADPVGYALAQVRPLRAIHTSDRKLAQVIAKLADAYQVVYRNGNSASASSNATRALNALDRLCPGASS